MNTMDRVGALSGVAYVVLINLGSAIVGEEAIGERSRGQWILDEYHRTAENPWTRLGLALLILGVMASIVFVGYLYSLVRDAGWIATTALIGGTLGILAYLSSMSIVFTVLVLRDDMSPELARTLTALDGAGHLAQLLPLGVFVLFASASALVTRTLGRVLSWAGMAIGATTIVVLAASGPPSNEDMFLWPFLLVILWTAVVSLRLGFARNRDTAGVAVAATAG